MLKIASWALGFSLGVAFGALLVMVLSPISGQEIVERFQNGYKEALDEARKASQQRRAELEAELAEMQGKRQNPNGTDPKLSQGSNRRG